MTKSTIGLFLLAATFLSSPAGAATLTPTLDTIKREAADLSGSFTLSELTGELPAGAVEVMIGDKSYYFTPSCDDAALLATLAGTKAMPAFMSNRVLCRRLSTVTKSTSPVLAKRIRLTTKRWVGLSLAGATASLISFRLTAGRIIRSVRTTTRRPSVWV